LLLDNSLSEAGELEVRFYSFEPEPVADAYDLLDPRLGSLTVIDVIHGRAKTAMSPYVTGYSVRRISMMSS